VYERPRRGHGTQPWSRHPLADEHGRNGSPTGDEPRPACASRTTRKSTAQSERARAARSGAHDSGPSRNGRAIWRVGPSPVHFRSPRVGAPSPLALATASDELRAGRSTARTLLLRPGGAGVKGGRSGAIGTRPSRSSDAGLRDAGSVGSAGGTTALWAGRPAAPDPSRRRIEPCVRFSRTRLTDIVHRWQTQAWVSPFRSGDGHRAGSPTRS
jgi:hypothetical protein